MENLLNSKRKREIIQTQTRASRLKLQRVLEGENHFDKDGVITETYRKISDELDCVLKVENSKMSVIFPLRELENKSFIKSNVGR